MAPPKKRQQKKPATPAVTVAAPAQRKARGGGNGKGKGQAEAAGGEIDQAELLAMVQAAAAARRRIEAADGCVRVVGWLDAWVHLHY